VARRLMLIFLAPLVALVTVVYSTAWGVRLGSEHAAFVLVTCSYSSAKHNVGCSLGLASVEHLALSSRSLAPFLILAIFAAVAIGIRWYARELEIRKGPLLFADEREPIVPSMELR